MGRAPCCRCGNTIKICYGEIRTAMEIERKFTIKELPENLESYPFLLWVSYDCLIIYLLYKYSLDNCYNQGSSRIDHFVLLIYYHSRGNGLT